MKYKKKIQYITKGYVNRFIICNIQMLNKEEKTKLKPFFMNAGHVAILI